MAISLGSLYVELKANTAQFLDAMTKASVNTKAFAKDMQGALGKFGDLISNLGPMGERLAGVMNLLGEEASGAFSHLHQSDALLGAFAGITGGAAALGATLFGLAEHASEVGAKIYEASEKTGISAAQLSGLNALCKETGGDFDGLSTALAKAGVNLQKAINEPGGKAAKTLEGVGISAKVLSDEGLMPMGDRLQDVLKHIFALRGEGNQHIALSALLSKGWMNNVEVLKVLAEQGYGPAEAAARRFGIFFDDESARQAKQFQVELKEIQINLAGIGMAIGQKVMPYMKEWMTGLFAMMPRLEAWGLRILAVHAALTGVGIPLAIKMWREADAKFKESNQIQTDMLVRVDKLTAGAKAQGDELGNHLTPQVKTHHDALAGLIDREREQLAMLNTNGDQVLQLGVEYRHTVEEIQKMVKAGGSNTEALQAQALALDIFHKKLMDLPAIVPKLPKLFEKPEAPQLQMPSLAPGMIQQPQLAQLNLAQLSQLPRDMETTRTAEHALRMETDLSSKSFARLATAFPNLTEAEVAALPAGQRLIEQLSKMDKLGTMGDRFAELKNRMILDGQELGGKLVDILGHAVDQIEDKFSELVVKGHANFRQLLPEIGQSLVKAGLQKGVSTLLSGFGVKGVGSKPDGSASNPLHVIMAGAGSGASGAASAMGNLPQVMHSVTSSIGSVFGKIFGGFLEGGGDVSPGKAYVVGERHPEFFVPRVHGAVANSMAMGGQVAVHNHFYGVQDVDSFRRSSAQILGDFHRATSMAMARNG